MNDKVRLERGDDGVAVVTFDAPPLNLFDDEMGEGLRSAVADLDDDPPRAVLFRAENRAFTAGVDVHVFDAIEDSSGAEELFSGLIDLAVTVEELPCPTILSAHAMCLTWGFELALACDLILAGEGAQFGLVEARIGLTPAMGGPQRLAERAGTGRAKEFVFTGGLYEAETMHEWGVVNQVHPVDEVDAKARELAAFLAAGPTRAHATTKQILAILTREGLDDANAATARLCGGLWDTEDLQTGVTSFLSEGPGKASFSGR